MEAKNFRIGNYIESKEWGGFGAIEGIEITKEGFELKVKGYVHKFTNDGKTYFDLQPIECSEHILRNLLTWEFVGFGTRIIYKHMKFNAIKIEMCAEDVAVYFNDELISFKKYVHELQNLFFALANEELQFKSDM